MNTVDKRMLAAAIVEQAVLDIRISQQHKLINPDTFNANSKLPKQLPTLLDKEDIQSLATFINRDLDTFIEATGLQISADAIRHGIKINRGRPFKKFCSESSIQSYERRWKPNPLLPDTPKQKRKRKSKK